MSNLARIGAALLVALLAAVFWVVYTTPVEPAAGVAARGQSPAEWTDWSIWRGDRALTGVAATEVSDSPSLIWLTSVGGAVADRKVNVRLRDCRLDHRSAKKALTGVLKPGRIVPPSRASPPLRICGSCPDW